jgi:hypothetical protein
MLSLTVTEANAGAVNLYRRLNFESKHVFDAFVWEGCSIAIGLAISLRSDQIY